MSLVNTETGELLDTAAAERRAERISLRLDSIADNYAASRPTHRRRPTMNRRLAALLAALCASLIVAAAAAVTTAPANAGGSTPTPPSVRSTITGW